MKESIGSTFLYNIIFLFIIIVFGLLTATLNYYKAFKVNKAILNYIAMYSGYNVKSKEAIGNYLDSIGYSANAEGKSCSGDRHDGTLITNGVQNHYYCVYHHSDDRSRDEKNKNLMNADTNKKPIYHAYAVTTYLYIRLPIAGEFKVPVYTKGERMYNFSDNQVQEDM